MVKLIQKTKIFKIQPGCGSTKGSKFVDLFEKRYAIMNTGVLLKNYKKRAKKNWSQSKDETDIFEADENVGAEKNNGTIVDFDYESDNM